MDEYRIEKLGTYLKDFVDVKPGHSIYTERAINESIGVLVREGIFTPNGLQKDILRNCGVLLPLSFITKCTNT